MRWCRFGDARLGVVEGRVVRDVTAALDVLPPFHYPLPAHDVFIASLAAITARCRVLLPSAPSLPLEGVTFLSPIANPGKLVGAPVNYQKHLAEARGDHQIHANNPAHTLAIHEAGLFLKAGSSLVGAGEGVVIRMPRRRTDHEVELAVVIGREARHVSSRDSMAYVAGYAIGLDITVRGPEDRSFRKSPDTYSVLGPWLVTADEIPDPGCLELQVSVNGDRRQHSNTRHLVLGVPQLIELASSFYTLYPGDVIFTGTPEGVGPIGPGDEIVATIERIGTMRVQVRAADVPSEAIAGLAETLPA